MTPGSLPNFKTCSLIAAVAAALAIAFVVAIVATPAAQAQAFQVIHAFTGGEDGGNPEAGLTVDAAGNFYGTTEFGNQSAGTVFKLVHSRFGWVLTTLYSFGGGNGGSSPWVGWRSPVAERCMEPRPVEAEATANHLAVAQSFSRRPAARTYSTGQHRPMD